jgi:peptidoglycan hydrolase-like protein with peptidoglycan-binding domain
MKKVIMLILFCVVMISAYSTSYCETYTTKLFDHFGNNTSTNNYSSYSLAYDYLLDYSSTYENRRGFITDSSDVIRVGFHVESAVNSNKYIIFNPNYSGNTISVGSSGVIVKTLQEKLFIYGWYHKFGSKYDNYYEAVDGNFGEDTKSALKDMQTRLGISNDGICGPITWKMLSYRHVIR